MALKDVGKNTPAAEVVRRVLEAQGKPISLDELAVSMAGSWGRDFPNTPYDPVSLIYKLAANVLSCELDYEETGGKVPVVKLEEGIEDEVPLSPQLSAEVLNDNVDRYKRIKVSLPKS